MRSWKDCPKAERAKNTKRRYVAIVNLRNFKQKTDFAEIRKFRKIQFLISATKNWLGMEKLGESSNIYD